jgi:hypothetical protein
MCKWYDKQLILATNRIYCVIDDIANNPTEYPRKYYTMLSCSEYATFLRNSFIKNVIEEKQLYHMWISDRRELNTNAIQLLLDTFMGSYESHD